MKTSYFKKARSNVMPESTETIIKPYEVIFMVFSLLFPRYNVYQIRPAMDRIKNNPKKKLIAPSERNGLKASLAKLYSSASFKNY